MRQDEINRDLKGYISTKKDKPFWKFNNDGPKVKPKTDEEIAAMLHKDIEHKAHVEEAKITPEDKKELEVMEEKIEEVDAVEEKVMHEFDDERESLLKKFFKKLNFSKEKNEEDEGQAIVDAQMSNNPEVEMDEKEVRELLHGLHNWIIQLPSDKLEHFKNSREFELYTKYLRKHNLIK